MINFLRVTYKEGETEMKLRNGMPKVSKIQVIVGALLLTGSVAGATELATVNGKVITDKDLVSALGGLNEAQRSNAMKDMNTRRQVLISVIDQELLTQEAEKEKLDQDAEYKEAVAGFRKQFLANRILQKNLVAKFTDSAAKNYYENHKSKFSTDQIHAMHILVTDEAQAKDIAKKAKEPNADFQEMAEKLSKDPSAKNNRGDLGFFGRDRMVPEFTDAAFSGNPGDIIGPIKTAFGYHIIKVVDKHIGQPMTYDEVELKVKNELRNELIQSYVGKLKEQAKIQVQDKNLNSL